MLLGKSSTPEFQSTAHGRVGRNSVRTRQRRARQISISIHGPRESGPQLLPSWTVLSITSFQSTAHGRVGRNIPARSPAVYMVIFQSTAHGRVGRNTGY